MADQVPNRPENLPVSGAADRNGDSQLRLVTAEGSIVFPGHVEPTDNSPTVISKKKPTDASQPAAPSVNLRGRKLAHFELLEPIGVGGMAAVLRARDTQLDRVVALKILPPEMAKDPENVRRFHQEARAAARLDHENIARVFYCGEDQGLHFIAFEYVEGVNLRVLLDKRGKLPVGEAVRITLQIATGLEHAASRGVVHRDVKPSNIIISPGGRAKLVDMGLARSVGPPQDGTLTQSGVTLGTFDYISPEQAIEPREADSRSDIYSLGCTFYHMLTGQAPVPEGTAAKKLHHHQHMPPVDPRQLNPDIPDEVAIVLGRMMAKNPQDRYQRPVHLVQHLLKVAQKVGADDIPEGVLFVDAELPSDPRKRPLLLFSCAALSLAIILVLLSLAPPPRAALQASKTDVSHTDKPAPVRDVAASPGPKSPVRPAPSGKFLISSDKELDAAAKENKGPITTLTLRDTINLPEDGLVLQGDRKHHLKIVSQRPAEPCTIHFKYIPKFDTDAPPSDLIAGLIIDGGTVTFQNVIFEIEANKTPERPVAALGIKGPAKVHFERCTFRQVGVPLQRKLIAQKGDLVPVACLAVDNAGGDKAGRPQIELDQCFFETGQVAVGIAGPAEVVQKNCAFKAYSSLFHLRGDNADYGIALKLDHCSALVVHGPAFRVDDEATCELRVEHSIFSHPDKALSEGDEPHLIRQTTASKPLVHFEGKGNCYHNLNALWVRGDPPQLWPTLDEFRTQVKAANGAGDSGSAQLGWDKAIWVSATPWKGEQTLKEAFCLRPDIPELRDGDGKALGFEKCLDVTLSLPPFRPADSVAADPLLKNAKIVGPDEKEDPVAGRFKTLLQALVFARSGDVIYIKHGKNSRDIQVGPLILDNKPDVDVTLKPYPGMAPIINLDKTQDSEAAFFRLYDGRLVLEQLEFVLEPDQENFRSMAVVFMGGNASCSFKNCVITLRPWEANKFTRRVPLSVVTLGDTEGAMKMTPQSPRTSAEIHFVNSFVRGEGDVVTARASRPLELEATNTMFALAGSLMGIQAAAKEPPPDAESRIRLNHVSAFVAEPLLVFHGGKNPKGFVPTTVDGAQNSLFLGLGDKPFVAIETNEFSESPRDFLVWKGEHNAYAGFEKMLVIRPEQGQPFSSLNNKGWVDGYREADSKFPMTPPYNVAAVALRGVFWTTGPDLFTLNPDQREELLPFGAVLPIESLPALGKKETMP